MTHETITAALYNLQAQINEVVGLLKDTAKQPAKDETAGDIIKYSIRLAQLEGAFITLQQHAPALVEVSNQYPLPPLPPPPAASSPGAAAQTAMLTVNRTCDMNNMGKYFTSSGSHYH